MRSSFINVNRRGEIARNDRSGRISHLLAVIWFSTFTVGATAQAQQLPTAGPNVPLPEDPAAVIAVVGQSSILWGDIQPKVDFQIAKVLKEVGKEFPEEQLTVARTGLTRQALVQSIQNKMMSESFILEQVGTQAAEKRREVADMMASRARQMFHDNELKALQKKYDTENLTELDAKMRKDGSSLHARQREFTDMMLGHMYMRSKIDQDPNVTIAEINSRYSKDTDSYRHGAKATWEQLSVLFENHPTREAAFQAIVAIGNEALYQPNLRAIAKEKSEEPFADEGGLHKWTTQGSLASKPLDKQIFSIPTDKLSEIIEDDLGLHIVRVLGRRPAGVTPLADVQEEIRKKIKKEKLLDSQKEMMEEMKKRVPVWSIFPQDVPGANTLRRTEATSSMEESNFNGTPARAVSVKTPTKRGGSGIRGLRNGRSSR